MIGTWVNMIDMGGAMPAAATRGESRLRKSDQDRCDSHARSGTDGPA